MDHWLRPGRRWAARRTSGKSGPLAGWVALTRGPAAAPATATVTSEVVVGNSETPTESAATASRWATIHWTAAYSESAQSPPVSRRLPSHGDSLTSELRDPRSESSLFAAGPDHPAATGPFHLHAVELAARPANGLSESQLRSRLSESRTREKGEKREREERASERAIYRDRERERYTETERGIYRDRERERGKERGRERGGERETETETETET